MSVLAFRVQGKLWGQQYEHMQAHAFWSGGQYLHQGLKSYDAKPVPPEP